MRQQEANQFDKGLNLDTNPIAMSNHQLSGALNATMITMNGNELVLQNDMGNGKVDQAQLPEGYVPVGMKEYGGIVYVAAYNPIKGESQVGCFPSPQRNLPSNPLAGDEPTISDFTGADFFSQDGQTNNYHLTNSKVQKPLINSILRPGDKFLIRANDFTTTDTALANNYITLKVVTVDSENNSIDVTDQLMSYSGNITFTNFKKFLKSTVTTNLDNYYNVYRNKIAGKLYIQEELVIPSYINVGVSAELDDSNTELVNIILTPQAYNSDGEVWTTNTGLHYDLIVKNGNGAIVNPTNGKYAFNRTDQMSYEVVPYYTYISGNKYYIDTLQRQGAYDVSSIGSGKVTFNGNFKYYNDIVRNNIIIDYNIQAYVENSVWSLSNVYLEAYDIEDVFSSGNFSSSIFTNNGESANVIKVQLNPGNTFGSYSERLEYKDNPPNARKNLNVGKYYVARLVAITKKLAAPTPGEQRTDMFTPKTQKSSQWFTIITSSITNQDYLSPNVSSMYPIIDGEDKEFVLSWKTTFTEEQIQNTYTDTTDGITSSLITTQPSTNSPSTYTLHYTTDRAYSLKYRYKAETTVNYVKNLPFIPVFNPQIQYEEPKYTIQDVTYTGNSNIVNSNQLIQECTNQTCTFHQSRNTSNNSVDITIAQHAWSKLYSKLRQNPERQSLDADNIQKYTFQLEATTEAFLPYMPQYYSEDNKSTLQRLLGPLNFNTIVPNAEISGIDEKNWLVYSVDTISWSDTGSWYESDSTRTSRWNTYANQQIYTVKGVAPGDGQTAILGHLTPIYVDSYQDKNSPKDWNSVQSSFKSQAGNPVIAFWHGAGSDATSINSAQNTESYMRSYAFMMMQDESGNYYVLNQFNRTGTALLIKVLKAFSKIYIPQKDQYVSFDYWTGSNDPNEYTYNNPYKVKINTGVYTYTVNGNENLTKSALTLKLDDDSTSKFNNVGSYSVGNTVYKLPTFRLAEVTPENSKAEYEYQIDSPDQSIMNAKLLDVSTPVLQACAIIKDSHGNTPITTAYKVAPNGSMSTVPFNLAHQYVLCELPSDPKNAKLVDIQESSIEGIALTTLGRYATEIANYLKSGKFVVRAQEGNSAYKAIYISNADQFTTIGPSSNYYWLGDIYGSQCCGQINVRINVSKLATIKDIRILNEGLLENRNVVRFNN